MVTPRRAPCSRRYETYEKTFPAFRQRLRSFRRAHTWCYHYRFRFQTRFLNMLRPSPTAAVLLGLMAALAAGASSAAPSTTAPMGFGDARVLLHERADIMAADRAEIARAESEAEAAKSLSGPKVEMDVKQVWGTKTVDLGIDTGLRTALRPRRPDRRRARTDHLGSGAEVQPHRHPLQGGHRRAACGRDGHASHLHGRSHHRAAERAQPQGERDARRPRHAREHA